MSEQVWNFAQIAAGSAEIQGAVGKTAGLLEEGQASLAALAGVWGGDGSEAYQQVQRNWDTASANLNDALMNLAHKVQEASDTMGQTEAAVAGSF